MKVSIKQQQKIDSIKGYLKSYKSMLLFDDEILIDIDNDSFSNIKTIWLKIKTTKMTGKVKETKLWCDVYIGVKGGITGQYDRDSPLKTWL